MSLSLSNLKAPAGKANRKRKRIGRGNAAGKGTYAGRGLKGQRSRSGGKGGLKIKALRKRLQSVPKLRGFNSPHKKADTVNVGELDQVFSADTIISPRILLKHGLVSNVRHKVKILGEGTVSKAFIIRKCAVSASAKAKIEKAGGTVEVAEKVKGKKKAAPKKAVKKAKPKAKLDVKKEKVKPETKTKENKEDKKE